MKETQLAYDYLFKDVREIISVARSVFEETTNLLSLLDGGGDGESVDQSVEQRGNTQAALLLQQSYHFKMGSNLIASNEKSVDGYFSTLEELLDKHSELTRTESIDIPGRIREMQTRWSKVKWTWPVEGESSSLPASMELIFKLQEVKMALSELIKQGEIVTFPDLVNQQLSDLHTGAYLDFFATFKNDFDTPERLRDVWSYLQEHTARINGIMVEPGLIYRASPSHLRRALSFVYITGIIAAGALLLLLCHGLEILPYDKGPEGLHNLLLGYGAVMVGGFAHSFVEIYKQYSVDREQTLLLLDNSTLWLHIKEMNVIGGILLLIVGYCIYYYISHGADWQTAFFIGYSIDSFLELFLMRFTGIASQRVQAAASRSLALSSVVACESPKPVVVGKKA